MKFEDLSPEKLTLGELFSYKGKYIVPGYQRPYEWDTKQVENFLNTICNAFDLNPNELLLFGTVQFNLVNNKRIEMDREIIDGHQRFTTFYLLMKYIGIQIDIQYENDILNTSSIDDLLAENTPNNLYKKNYEYIEEHIGKYKNNEKFKNFVKEKIILISIEISNCTSIDDTLQVFNSLNTTGLQLQVASVDGVNGFAKELIDWSGYGKLKNLYYYLIYIQYINDKQVDFNKIKKAESFTVELVKFCSFFRFTHSKIKLFSHSALMYIVLLNMKQTKSTKE